MARKYKWDSGLETLKTKVEEITVGEFQKILKLQTSYSEKITFEYYLDMFEILGLSEQFVDAMDSETMFSIIKEFQDDFKVTDEELQNEVTINDRTYTSHPEGSNFVISARLMATAEKYMGTKPYGWISYTLAHIFKENGRVENLREHNYLKNKAKQMEQVTLDVALPFIHSISKDYMANIKIILDENENEDA